MNRKSTVLPRRALVILIAGLLAVPAFDAEAARTCRLRIRAVAFGVYPPATPSPLDSAGRVRVICRGRPNQGQASFYVLRIDGGSSGNPASRNMLAGGSPLFYNLFKDAARTDIWGDGTAGTTPVIQNLPSSGRFTMNHPVYGRASASQDPAPGTYGDIPMVTIEF